MEREATILSWAASSQSQAAAGRAPLSAGCGEGGDGGGVGPKARVEGGKEGGEVVVGSYQGGVGGRNFLAAVTMTRRKKYGPDLTHERRIRVPITE